MFTIPRIFLLLTISRFASSCGDVCNEDDGAYVMSTFPNVAPVPSCSAGYTVFSRPGYNWCMKIYPAISRTFTQAEALCLADGAVASGHQNVVEARWINRTATAIQTENNEPIGGVWLGLHITMGCDYLGFANEPNCGANSFEWTDGYTTGTSQITWASGIPDQPNTGKCALMAAYDPILYPTGQRALPTQIVNVACGNSDGYDDYRKRTTIVCGKPPTEYS
ncbi:unnamed protein product [Caenorhabditis angaria]|uniref:C-type lectin domain-containing protein n=1 Tax=Caenorhabditis angaria TaxID=860376 RepID=A0A9P1IT10_9PELO|nr:unnamed protein product [Caenorhabditis angaria]